MATVLFIFYLLLFCWLLTKSRFIAVAGLPKKIIIGLFLLKVLVGCLHPWILKRTNGMLDTIAFQREGLAEYHLLWHDPKVYLTNLFYSPYPTGYGGLFSSSHSYWNNLKDNLIIKYLSVCDIFSFGDYYINIIFYNYSVFFGAVALFRVFKTIYPNKNKLLVTGVFLLPSQLFFTSAIHKEGLMYAALGIAAFIIHTSVQIGFNYKRIIYTFLVLLFIFLQRNYVLIAFLAAAFAWVFSVRKKFPVMLVFVVIYIMAGTVFFTVSCIIPKLQLPQIVVNKQTDFKQLGVGNTNLPLHQLYPNINSFVKNLPQAVNHAAFRPYFTDVHLSRGLWPLALELVAYLVLFGLFLFFRKQKNKVDPFIIFCHFFAGSVLLFIGYTVPAIGAIVRYRSIYLPFIITPMLCAVHWNKIFLLFNYKIK